MDKDMTKEGMTLFLRQLWYDALQSAFVSGCTPKEAYAEAQAVLDDYAKHAKKRDDRIAAILSNLNFY